MPLSGLQRLHDGDVAWDAVPEQLWLLKPPVVTVFNSGIFSAGAKSRIRPGPPPPIDSPNGQKWARRPSRLSRNGEQRPVGTAPANARTPKPRLRLGGARSYPPPPPPPPVPGPTPFLLGVGAGADSGPCAAARNRGARRGGMADQIGSGTAAGQLRYRRRHAGVFSACSRVSA